MNKFFNILKSFENNIKKEMGIKNIAVQDFSLNLKESALTELEIELKTKGRDVSIKDIEVAQDNTLEYRGKKVVLYMRDQYHPTEKAYKYHIAWCDHLESMQGKGRMARYVVNNRKDGKFVVNVFSSTYRDMLIEEGMETSMDVCVQCLDKLKYKGFEFHPARYKRAVQSFNLEEFYKEYTPEWVGEMDLNSNKLQPINTYSKNWSDISRSYREYMGWMCEKCGKDCSDNRSGLEVHHKNSNKFDSSMSNLQALCKECHAEVHEFENWK